VIIQQLPSQQYGPRPAGVVIDTLVIHSMHHPEHQDCFSPKLCGEWLDKCGVSAHYIIDRSGSVWQAVPDMAMAWHAGESCMPFADDCRTRVNDFSLGVELLGTETSGFTQVQYQNLVFLVGELCQRHPLTNIVGHQAIAPTRKTDPWLFDWPYFKSQLKAVFSQYSKLRIGQ